MWRFLGLEHAIAAAHPFGGIPDLTPPPTHKRASTLQVLAQFQAFYNRPDTFSLGICNGCQLMALLGWVPATAAPGGGTAAQLPDAAQPRFVHNASGR